MIKILSGTQTREWTNQVQEELCNTQVCIKYKRNYVTPSYV